MTTDWLIVGGGGLGLLLADALSQPDAHRRDFTRVSILNRRNLPPLLKLHTSHDSTARNIAVRTYSCTQFEWLGQYLSPQSKGLILLLCVPPESASEVFGAWLQALKSTSPEIPVLFVFCNNGLLSADDLARISAAPKHFSFVRSIFFLGAIRVLSNDECVVTRTGGRSVSWGYLSPVDDANVNVLAAWTEFTSPAADAHDDSAGCSNETLDWRFDKQILRTERNKFFTNFMIATAVGPHLAKNSSVWLNTTAEFRGFQAELFANLWRHLAISKESLLQNLNETVRATAENFNSISLQAVRGSTSTIEYFVRTIADEVKASGRMEEFSALTEFTEQVRKQWGVQT